MIVGSGEGGVVCGTLSVYLSAQLALLYGIVQLHSNQLPAAVRQPYDAITSASVKRVQSSHHTTSLHLTPLLLRLNVAASAHYRLCRMSSWWHTLPSSQLRLRALHLAHQND